MRVIVNGDTYGETYLSNRDLVLGGIRSRARSVARSLVLFRAHTHAPPRREHIVNKEMPREKFVGPTWQRGDLRRVLRAFGAV